MKIFILILFGALTLFGFNTCSENPTEPEEENKHFAIYFLKDSKIKIGEIIEDDLSGLKLQPKPWISDEDIDFYDWSSHCIYLKEDKTYFIPGWQKEEIFNVFPVEWADKPFVVTANNKKCYLGYFSHIDLSLNSWIAPMIGDGGFNSIYPQDVIWIDWGWLYHDSPQNNSNVKNALINAGLYHGGIAITFDPTDTNTLRMVENADTSTISYKFIITNNDVDDLYVIDPDNTGSDLFHLFTNGLTFQNIETKKIYEPRWRKHVELPSRDYWSPDWFTKLKNGHSIQRTVILKGYPYFPTGEYIFQFKYYGQILGMEKEAREVADGRYWLGPTRSNILVWNFNADEDTLNKKIVAGQHLRKNQRQQIYEMNNTLSDEYLPVTSTLQQLKLKRR